MLTVAADPVVTMKSCTPETPDIGSCTVMLALIPPVSAVTGMKLNCPAPLVIWMVEGSTAAGF